MRLKIRTLWLMQSKNSCEDLLSCFVGWTTSLNSIQRVFFPITHSHKLRTERFVVLGLIPLPFFPLNQQKVSGYHLQTYNMDLTKKFAIKNRKKTVCIVE
jgi:hypothetical protein